jgi:hypothetical protein
MSISPTNCWKLLLVWAFLFAFNSAASAVGWFDDFNDGSVLDGNPQIWSKQDIGNPPSPGTYDATSGDYRLMTPGDPNTNTLTTWVDNMSFTDTYVRAQGLVLPTELDGNLLLLGRIDKEQMNTYILSLDSSGELQLQVVLFGGFFRRDLKTENLGGLNAKSDVIFELDVITDPTIGGNRLYGYVWRPGSQKPADPQIEAIDNEYPGFGYLLQGPAGIGFNEVTNYTDNNTAGLFRVVAAQNAPFIEGDYDFNGKIDASDYVFWRKNGGAAADYSTWRANFGLPSAAGGFASNNTATYASVPEPTNTLHLALAFIFAFGTYRHQLRCNWCYERAQ